MKITDIQINNFGKIVDKSIELKDGINIVYGENEAGKSTVLKFITSMFYGVSKNKKGKNISDFDKYRPWSGDSNFSGKIKYVLDNEEEYEIFREFKKKNPVIYNNYGEDISKKFSIDKAKGINFIEKQIGIDENLFLNTAIIGQQEIKLENANTNVIVQKISNLVSTGDDNMSFKKSIEKLNKMQNESVGTDRTKQKPINVVEEKINKLLYEKKDIENYKEKYNNFLEEKEKLNIKIDELIDKKNRLKNEKKNIETAKIENVQKEFKLKIKLIIFVLFLMISLLMFVFVKNIVADVLSIVPIILTLIFIIQDKKKKIDENFEFNNQLEDKLENIDNKINEIKVQKQVLDSKKEDIDAKLSRLTNIEEELQEQINYKNELISLDTSFNIAKECLERAYNEIKNNISPKFEQKLCEIVSEITNGKYSRIKVNDKEGMYIEVENGLYIPVDRLSVGTIDQMYLALRLSTLSEINEVVPIIFDETFAYFDDNRLKNILCYLQDKNYNNQIIIFTCSNREERLLNELKIEYNKINL